MEYSNIHDLVNSDFMESDDSESGRSDFDEEYYKNRPPFSLNYSDLNIVTIKKNQFTPDNENILITNSLGTLAYRRNSLSTKKSFSSENSEFSCESDTIKMINNDDRAIKASQDGSNETQWLCNEYRPKELGENSIVRKLKEKQRIYQVQEHQSTLPFISFIFYACVAFVLINWMNQ